MSLIQVRHYDKTWPRLSLALRVAEFVAKEGKGQARRFVGMNGLVLAYDKLWFSASVLEETHRVIGENGQWDVELTFLKGDPFKNTKPDPSVKLAHMRFMDREAWFIRAALTNVDGFEKDMTLLRMFGPEELFSGQK